ncbi:MAG: YqhA family protein [Flavobacteriales bacterium]|nr:YqhA family protein [Flavobacteriales bacterium]
MRSVLRAAVMVIGLVLVIDALVLVFRGLWMTYEAYHDLLTRPDVERPLLPALEAVDVFFMAIALFIVAVGLVQLFIGDLPFLKDVSFAWMRVESYTQLKLLLWDTFLVTLLVLFLTRIFAARTMGWDVLILPGAILMLTVSSFLLKKGKH